MSNVVTAASCRAWSSPYGTIVARRVPVIVVFDWSLQKHSNVSDKSNGDPPPSIFAYKLERPSDVARGMSPFYIPAPHIIKVIYCALRGVHILYKPILTPPPLCFLLRLWQHCPHACTHECGSHVPAVGLLTPNTLHSSEQPGLILLMLCYCFVVPLLLFLLMLHHLPARDFTRLLPLVRMLP